MADADAAREAAGPAPTVPDPGSPPSTASADDPTMSLVDHLNELRGRIVKTVAAILVFAVVGYIRAGAIIDFLRGPIGDRKLVSLSAGGPFFLYIKIALVVGLILGMPVILYQAWAFVAPGLTPEERRIVRPWVPVALLFFVIGVIVAWIVLPFALGFLFSYESASIQITLTIDNYFGFISTLFLAFGLTMQFPIVLYILSRVGIVSSERLRAARRYVILGIAVFATVVTPGGDLVSPTVLGVTMYLLFEISIIVIRRSGR
ncbi:MAG: twin-arginine translocase subunit TatC [Candidatus Limnocylindrales bacterium]